ncbi:MAG: septum formation protein Maf [Verrucomicrobia bacterium]|nr:septum formation protein Maf [Verrucomicrobiota bacterium]
MSASALPLLLASASPRRAELLRAAGLEFTVLTGQTDEVQPEHLSPTETAMINAYRKARTVAKRQPDALVLGADTVVALGTRLFAKPATRAAAEAMLGELQGKIHKVVTGVCLIQQRAHRQRTFATVTLVKLHRLTPAQIRAYLDRIQPLDKAGGYAIQEHGELIVEEIAGSFTNVVGLPLERVRAELEKW